jgi:hypothetical protein
LLDQIIISHVSFYREKVMDYTIHPFEGVGPIKLGMTPQQVRAVLGEPDDSFKKGGKGFPTDAYDTLSVHVLYEHPGICNEIWLFLEPDDPTSGCNPTFQGYGLKGRTFAELKPWFQKLGTPVQHFDIGCVFLKYGMYVTSQHYSYHQGNVDEPVDTVSVCSESIIARGMTYDDDEFPIEEAISM